MVRVLKFSKSKPERLYSFAIGEKHNQMTLLEVEVLDLDDFFVRPVNRWAFIYFQ
jgi:hypothetical protein